MKYIALYLYYYKEQANTYIYMFQLLVHLMNLEVKQSVANGFTLRAFLQ